jgi:hypothetical protein
VVVHNLLPAIPRLTPTLSLRVRAKDVVADGVVSLILDHPDGTRLPDWTPGAHIDLVLPKRQQPPTSPRRVTPTPSPRNTSPTPSPCSGPCARPALSSACPASPHAPGHHPSTRVVLRTLPRR